MDYAKCEDRKLMARWQFSQPNASLDEKARAMLTVAESHFRRSQKSNPYGHPELDEYVHHWVWACLENWCKDPHVVDELKRRYPRPNVMRLRQGKTYWVEPWVLLKLNASPSRVPHIKPWHIEPERRYLNAPPNNPNWMYIGTFDSYQDVLAYLENIAGKAALPSGNRKNVTPKTRYEVLARDNFTCQICGAKAETGAELEVDHRIPVSKNGSNHISNLWTLCRLCNRGKGTRRI